MICAKQCVVRCFETVERVKSEYWIASDWTEAGKSVALKTSVGRGRGGGGKGGNRIEIEESITIAYSEVCATKFV